MFLCKCSFRYQSSRLFLGKNRDTARASSCHPWTRTYWAGLVLQSRMVEVECPCVSVGLWEVEAVDSESAFSPPPFAPGLCVSQVKSDCVAQRRSCCNGMLAYYFWSFVHEFFFLIFLFDSKLFIYLLFVLLFHPFPCCLILCFFFFINIFPLPLTSISNIIINLLILLVLFCFIIILIAIKSAHLFFLVTNN